MAIQNAILLADDSEDDQMLLKRLFRLAGLANPLILVRDGEEAIAYLSGEGIYADREKHPIPRVLMLDLKMPKKSGFDVLEWMKGRPELKTVTVVVLTGSGQVEDLQRSYAMGAKSFLAKPPKVEDLRNLADGFPDQWSGAS